MDDIRYDGNLDVEIRNVGFVSVLRNENYTFEYKNGKERYSFIYVKSGEIKYCFAKQAKTFTVKKGGFLFVPKNLPYKTIYLKDNTVIRIIVFDIASKKLPSYFHTPFSKQSLDIAQIFDSIVIENMYSALFLTGKIYELIFCIEKELLDAPKRYKKIIPAINEVKQKYAENNKVSYYADLCNMSESNFRKLFKEYTGKSFIEYRNIIRISAVKRMLDSGELSISEAAYFAGFNNMSFFYEVYNRFVEK